MSGRFGVHAIAGRPAPLVRLHGLSKDYAGVEVVRDLSLDVSPGSIHAIAGENGAGKSTLINMIAGATAPSAGSITIDGRSFAALTPALAGSVGVRLVAQERQVCPDLSVAENILMGRHPRGKRRVGLIDPAKAVDDAWERLVRVGLDIDPRIPLRELSVAQSKGVEIARALSAGAKLVILDEPTAALPTEDVKLLFGVLTSLRQRGVTVLYVSHHLEEIFELADTTTVLRDGKHVSTQATSTLSLDRLITLILGRELQRGDFRRQRAEGAPVLEARNISIPHFLHKVSLVVREAELLAVTGGAGSGRTELARSLAGVERLSAGAVVLPSGERVTSPAQAVRRGIAFLPEDRKRNGILATRDVVDNIAVGWMATARSCLNRPSRRCRDAAEQVRRLRVKAAGMDQHVRLLSGGNQQKILLGRWLNVGAKVLLLDGPTQGVDIGSRFEIYELLRSLTERGVAVVIFTTDLEEARLVADRAVVMRRGQIAGELLGEQITEAALLALEHGGPSQQESNA